MTQGVVVLPPQRAQHTDCRCRMRQGRDGINSVRTVELLDTDMAVLTGVDHVGVANTALEEESRDLLQPNGKSAVQTSRKRRRLLASFKDSITFGCMTVCRLRLPLKHFAANLKSTTQNDKSPRIPTTFSAGEAATGVGEERQPLQEMKKTEPHRRRRYNLGVPAKRWSPA